MLVKNNKRIVNMITSAVSHGVRHLQTAAEGLPAWSDLHLPLLPSQTSGTRQFRIPWCKMTHHDRFLRDAAETETITMAPLYTVHQRTLSRASDGFGSIGQKVQEG